ncbi:hypothetical protein GJ496_009091 [Pomphorhynchus laevis]|nr:hypothetical protein GJ496_009091 [Pomphorhynchus laevis]
MLGHGHDPVCDQICGVEAYSKLSNHADVGSALYDLHNVQCPTAGNRAQIVHHVALRHANDGVDDVQLLVLVGNDMDVELLAGVEFGRVGQGFVPDFA